jgi:hypothetical protein
MIEADDGMMLISAAQRGDQLHRSRCHRSISKTAIR